MVKPITEGELANLSNVVYEKGRLGLRDKMDAKVWDWEGRKIEAF